jgi:hypothetical protein
MPKEPENIVHVLLRDIRAKQDEHFTKLEAVETRVRHVESQLDDLRMAVTYALCQSTETQFRQSKQGARIDELFAQLEKLLANRETPVMRAGAIHSSIEMRMPGANPASEPVRAAAE